MFAPLTGVRVVDLTHVLAGPHCGALLAAMGAEVIKVEPPGGDPTRRAGPIDELNRADMGLLFCTQNAGKASITVDLTHPDGGQIIGDLLDRSPSEDVVLMENYRPGVADRLGLGWDQLKANRPGLVYLSLSAYGQDGPLAGRPAYDHVVQAMSGVMETTGTDETGPVKVGAPIVDYATGQKAAMAIVAAIMERRRTGQAQRVDCAMLDSMLLLMANTVTDAANTGRRPAKLGNQAASLAPSAGTFDTADGLLAIAANNERQFQRLCTGIGRPDLAADDRFATPKVRRANGDAFRRELEAALANESAEAWETILDQAGVPVARVRSVDQVVAEGQPRARHLLVEVDLAADGLSSPITVQIPSAGFKVNGEVPSATGPPPELNADTDRLLTELGYSTTDIDRLRKAGTI